MKTRSMSLKHFPTVIIIFLAFLLGTNHLYAQVKLTEKAWVLPTWSVAPPDRNPIFFRNEAYQGASRHYYPLKLNDQYIHERVEKPWHTLLLENEYIELAITPEIGGKLYYATDKANDYHFIYKNNVVKPSNIGMTGAWVSGGIEWCVLHHHRASTFLPVDYTTTENPDGSKTIWVGETEPRHGMRWSIGITLRPGKSYFELEGRIHNSSPLTHTFLYWANVAAHANENYQTIFPPSAQVATYHSKTSFTRWPYSTEIYTGQDFTEGVDISWWKNVVNSNSFFVHNLKEDFMGGYDYGKNSGTVHIGDHNIVKGAKLWEWGSGPRGQATEGRLTEDDGPYVEIMVGAFSDNQPDYSWIRPYELKRWKQYWYPVRDIGGFKNANLNGAVNLEKRENNSVFLGYYSTQKVRNAKVVLQHNDKVVFEKNLEISPDKPFTQTIKLDSDFNLNELYTRLTDFDSNEILVEYQPKELEPVEELPETVKGYPDPTEIETVEELYLTGSRVAQFYSPRHNPMDWFSEALKRDPNDVRTNTAVGNIYLKNGDYTAARSYFSRAINRLTKDYTRPSTGEALYLQGLTLKALGLIDEAIDTLYRATWDYAWHSAAYYQLAQISVSRGDFEKALFQINESLSTNTRNNSAVALKASILRLQGNHKEAISILKEVIKTDPLDFRLNFEYYLTVRASGQVQEAGRNLKSLTEMMRGFDQNYLDLAVGYINDGLLSDAEEVLLRFTGHYSIIEYYLGYLNDQLGNSAKATDYFKIASDMSTDYVFPHRLKTIDVLQTALKYNPGDGKAYYYIGNILYEKQPTKAIENWENAIKHDPDLAIAYRNLGWGYYRHYGDGYKAISYYEKAITLNKNEAIYYYELDALYEMSNAPIEKRLALFDGKNEIVKNRDDAFIRQIAVLTLSGQSEKAVDYLDGIQLGYREGSSQGREVMIDAYLMAGKKFLERNEAEKALAHFLKAQVPEEEAGSARFGNRDIQVNYYIGRAYETLGNKQQSESFYQRAANHETRATDVMAYYQGLSFSKLGNEVRAKEIFEAMIEGGNERLQGTPGASEYGVIFGEQEAENTRISQSYTLRGLGYKGIGQASRALADLKKAVGLSVSNLWATSELENL
jgi:tetratricopeptide (TPR) repeat protein